MADGEQTRGRYMEESLPEVVPAPHETEAAHGRARADHERGEEVRPAARFEMELVDELPGGRAIIGVEQEGIFRWLGSRQHVTEQARDEFVAQLTEIVEKGLWTQNWTGR